MQPNTTPFEQTIARFKRLSPLVTESDLPLVHAFIDRLVQKIGEETLDRRLAVGVGVAEEVERDGFRR